MKEHAIGILAGAVIRLIMFLVPRVSDKAIGRFMRRVERLVYIITGDKSVADAVAEVADIFETGPPFTTTVRKIVDGVEPEIIVSAVKKLTRPSPYGAL